MPPFDETHYQEIAASRGFKFVGEVPANNRTRTLWECSQGHQWLAQPKNIQSGTGCPICANEKRRQAPATSRPWVDRDSKAPNTSLTEFDYYEAAERNGITWLGPLQASTKAPTAWRCRRGHEWQAPYTNIVFSKSGCPQCAIESNRNSEEDYRRIGLRHSLTFVGPLPESTRIKTWWECQSGHHFAKRLKSIQCGEGCPVCHWLTYPKHRDTGAHTVRLCDGRVCTLETLVEAEYEKQYWDAVGCSPDCCKDHPLAKL